MNPSTKAVRPTLFSVVYGLTFAGQLVPLSVHVLEDQEELEAPEVPLVVSAQVDEELPPVQLFPASRWAS